MAKLIFEHSGEEVEIEDGSRIQEICEEEGVPFACTEGVCGTCVVMIKKGKENLSSKTQEEIDFLGEEDVDEEDFEEERLACQCVIQKGEVTLTY